MTKGSRKDFEGEVFGMSSFHLCGNKSFFHSLKRCKWEQLPEYHKPKYRKRINLQFFSKIEVNDSLATSLPPMIQSEATKKDPFKER